MREPAHELFEGNDMRATIAAIALSSTVLSTPAHASGGLWCGNEGGPVKISIESGVTRGMGFPVFNFRASAEVDDQSIGADLRKITFDGGNLPQYWSEDDELKMVLYRERDGGTFGSVQIIVRTKMADDAAEYQGTYSYVAQDAGGQGSSLELSGEISCGME